MPDQEQEQTVAAASQPEPQKAASGKKEIYSCNFRSAGRLSNENARSLTAIHETFARHLSGALDAFLGTGVEVKLTGIDQLPIKEHINRIPPLTYIIPFSLSTMPSTMIVECDINLVFPMIDLLLGGSGAPETGAARELSEIEEEIMLEVIRMIVQQAETAWHMASGSLIAARRVKSSVLHHYCPPNEKITLAKFEFDISGTAGSFQLVFPTAFLSILIQQIKLDSPQKRGSVRYFPRPSIRERILDCDVEVAAELQNLRVAVKDLVGLQMGSVLKLRAPVRSPGALTVGGRVIFEAAPVRNGSQKAAQLGRRIASSTWERA
jgi:flagellar motor switch protein FliM